MSPLVETPHLSTKATSRWALGITEDKRPGSPELPAPASSRGRSRFAFAPRLPVLWTRTCRIAALTSPEPGFRGRPSPVAPRETFTGPLTARIECVSSGPGLRPAHHFPVRTGGSPGPRNKFAGSWRGRLLCGVGAVQTRRGAGCVDRSPEHVPGAATPALCGPSEHGSPTV